MINLNLILLKSYVKIIDPGFYTSIQDNGRYGYRNIGFPVSGAMDFYSYQKSNLLVGNTNNEAALECTIKGPSILFSGPSWVAISGAKTEILINNKKVKSDKPFFCDLGDFLKLGNIYDGHRCYISFSGGIATEKIHGSHSQYYPLTNKSVINKADKIPINGKKTLEKIKLNTFNLKTFDGYIDVIRGPDWEMINNLTKNKLVDQEFVIGSNNRMAYILSGLNIKNRLSILSSSILPGTVQLTPNGDLIVVMRDGQITGGYPRILQLTEMSQSKLSQCFLGQKIVFKISEPDKLHQKIF